MKPTWQAAEMPEPISGEMYAIDEKIRTYEDIIRALKSERNEKTTICRKIPFEILCQILTQAAMAADDSKNVFKLQSSYVSFMDLVKLTSVCRHFRQALLGDPTVWGDFFFEGSAAWNKEQLKRADERNTLIRCYAHSVLLESSSMRKIFFDHDIQKIGQRLLEPTPALRSLSLRVRESSTYGDIDVFASSEQTFVELPAGALMSAPSLRRLSLNFCGISWLAATFPKMTHLEVADPPETMREPWPIMLEALRSMPFLESLILKNACGVNTLDVDADVSILRLEKLSVLKLSCTVAVFSHFLRYLSFTGLTRFSLILDGPDFHPAVAALQAISVHSMDMLDVFRPTLYIKRMNPQHLPGVVIASGPNPAVYELQFKVTGSDAGVGRSRGYMTMLQTIGHALPLPQVHYLHLTNGHEEITGPKFAVLNRCVRLHEIQLIGLYGMRYLFNALESVEVLEHPGIGQKKPTMMFPLLKKMVISAADFAGDCNAETVRGALAKRAKMNLPIKELHLKTCSNLSEIDVTKMEPHTQVNWDGDEYFEADEDEDEDSLYGSDNSYDALGISEEQWKGTETLSDMSAKIQSPIVKKESDLCLHIALL
ncbi:hypothetical protein CYLTODRAFT_490508 [Cylindrobasidium torrendii FP15055 ss-10]|uniref:Uncharacterized protein n=1 Tax=Cylindrobasidium torrendii FP15055 ss-10 TaxID=1314674 RepID=A0A0D7BAP3_9AGAR|nr:hypothetical protein CYLTODRAFT_490508 [Cylindrobasidium torrendii FP15055 ss-10]